MNKTKPEIAKAILERRNRMTHVIMPGDINAAIGPDGVSVALAERWLVPDTDTGFLCATNDLSKIEEMRKLAEMKPEEYKLPPIQVLESHDSTILHTKRQHRLNEIAAPMTGGASPGLSTLSQPQPPPPQAAQPPTGQPNDSLAVGSPVTVARGGRPSSGVIEKLLPDGRYQLAFADPAQKPPGDNVFSKDEMTVVPSSPQRSPVTAP